MLNENGLKSMLRPGNSQMLSENGAKNATHETKLLIDALYVRRVLALITQNSFVVLVNKFIF